MFNNYSRVENSNLLLNDNGITDLVTFNPLLLQLQSGTFNVFKQSPV